MDGIEVSTLVGHKIKTILFKRERLEVAFDDLEGIFYFENGSVDSEAAFMTTDDDIESFTGSVFLGVELAGITVSEPIESPSSYEIQFLKFNTSIGTFTIESHDKLSGFYGEIILHISQH